MATHYIPTLERLERRLLRAASDFCAADEQVKLARRQWREIHDLHDPYDGVYCLPWETENGNRSDELPRSEWCEHCIRIIGEAVDYQYALWKRRSAKTRMKRANKEIELLRSDGPS